VSAQATFCRWCTACQDADLMVWVLRRGAAAAAAAAAGDSHAVLGRKGSAVVHCTQPYVGADGALHVKMLRFGSAAAVLLPQVTPVPCWAARAAQWYSPATTRPRATMRCSACRCGHAVMELPSISRYAKRGRAMVSRS
jgi:hypothetical protein